MKVAPPKNFSKMATSVSSGRRQSINQGDSDHSNVVNNDSI